MIDKKLVIKQMEHLVGQIEWLKANVTQFENDYDGLHNGLTKMRLEARELCRRVEGRVK